VNYLGSLNIPSIWGKNTMASSASNDANLGPDGVAAQQMCCEQLSQINAYVKRLADILNQLNTKKSVPTADQRLDLLVSEIGARISEQK
jgi:hypothetical protein